MADVNYIVLTLRGGTTVTVVEGSPLHVTYSRLGATPPTTDLTPPAVRFAFGPTRPTNPQPGTVYIATPV